MPTEPTARLIVGLHLGAHKTATSLIQHRLGALGGRLGGKPFLFRGNKALKTEAWARHCRMKAPRGDVAASFAAELALWRGTGGPIVLSDEDFLGTTSFAFGGALYPEAAERLARIAALFATAPDLDIRPIFYVRQTSSFIASSLSQEMLRRKQRRGGPADATAPPLRFRPVVEAIEAAFGRPIAVRRYEAIAELGGLGYVLDFLEALGLAAPTATERAWRLGGAMDSLPRRLRDLARPLVRPNVSLSARGMTMAEALRPLVDDAEWRKVVRPFLQKNFNTLTDKERPIELNKRLRATLDAAFAEDLAFLGDRLAFRYPAITDSPA